MARKIKATEEAAGPAPVAAEAPNAGTSKDSATFVCNFTNQEIKFPDGTSFVVRQARFTVSDPKVIENLRAVAAEKHIFEAK